LRCAGRGNRERHYKGKPKLNFDVLKKNRTLMDIPLVLHGGSGIPPDDFRKVIRMGVCKINIGTANLTPGSTGRKNTSPGGKNRTILR
jgi:fructose/tagatose bisphosphate aldolase